jgi:hypothetical protein
MDPGTPSGTAGPSNSFYFAQLEEIERFGLTTMYIDFRNLQAFTVNGETGVLAQAIAQQYYRYDSSFSLLIQISSILAPSSPSIHQEI